MIRIYLGYINISAVFVGHFAKGVYEKILRSIKFISQIIVICLTLFTLVGCERGAIHSDDLLTPGERKWLRQHDGKITLAMETNYAPFAFVDKNRKNTGLATDYIQLIQKKLKFRSNEIRFNSLNKIMESARASKIDIVNAVTETPNRSSYLLFTKPFIEMPNVIIVRKERKESITINQLKEMTVSLIKDYAVTEYFLENHDSMNVDLVPDVLTALLNVSFNQTDAAILDLATASYIIHQKGITNLRVAGDAGHSIKLAIGSRKDWPVLNQILNKGLAAISEQEHKSIRDKWVAFDHIPLFKSGNFWMVIIVICIVFFLCIVTVLFWNKILKRQVEQRTRQLASELRERKKVEEALRESEMRFSLAMQASQDGLFDWNIITDEIYYSPGWKRLLGYEDHEIKNEFSAWEQLTDPENVKESWTIMSFGRSEV